MINWEFPRTLANTDKKLLTKRITFSCSPPQFALCYNKSVTVILLMPFYDTALITSGRVRQTRYWMNFSWKTSMSWMWSSTARWKMVFAALFSFHCSVQYCVETNISSDHNMIFMQWIPWYLHGYLLNVVWKTSKLIRAIILISLTNVNCQVLIRECLHKTLFCSFCPFPHCITLQMLFIFSLQPTWLRSTFTQVKWIWKWIIAEAKTRKREWYSVSQNFQAPIESHLIHSVRSRRWDKFVCTKHMYTGRCGLKRTINKTCSFRHTA